MSLTTAFQSDHTRLPGVRPFNIYLLRLLFLLVFILVGYDAWTYILRYENPGDHVRAAAYCMWGAYALISAIGIFHPLKLLPLVFFEIIYKLIWLTIVAFPLWRAGQLAESPARGMTEAFLWVLLPVIAMPWRFFVRSYLLNTPVRPTHPPPL